MDTQLKRTPLYATHLELKARMVPFAGWELPVQYASILEEARAVRSRAGLFDVSHMGRLYIAGPQAPLLLDWLVTSDAAGLKVGRARYGLICNDQGGIIDDTVFYRRGPEKYTLICNAANRPKVVDWIRKWQEGRFPQTSLEDVTEATAMLAIQGPEAAEVLDACSPDTPSQLRPFAWMEATLMWHRGGRAFVGRTGYTGEDGFELVVPGQVAPQLWKRLLQLGAVSCGLGARDVLRLEAGLMLHGNDIDPSTTPLEAGLERFVALEKDFVGADALRKQKLSGLARRIVGLIVEGNHIARRGYPIVNTSKQVGQVTSGTFSPTLDRSIAMGYVASENTAPATRLQVNIRGALVDAHVVALPFYTRKRST